MNKNPSMEQASENLSNILNPKETEKERIMRIKHEILEELNKK